MARDLHYIPGSNYILDDISGFKIRVEDARMIPGGQTGNLYVAASRWEDQQPQDFVTGVMDEQAVQVARSRQPNQFVVLGTYVTAFSARLTSTITVDSAVGFLPGMLLLIMLDSGENYRTLLSSIANNVFTLTTALPANVGGDGLGSPIENSVLVIG